jgi:hypothetical protein
MTAEISALPFLVAGAGDQAIKVVADFNRPDIRRRRADYFAGNSVVSVSNSA